MASGSTGLCSAATIGDCIEEGELAGTKGPEWGGIHVGGVGGKPRESGDGGWLA